MLLRHRPGSLELSSEHFGLRFRVQSLGLRVHGRRFGVQGLSGLGLLWNLYDLDGCRVGDSI